MPVGNDEVQRPEDMRDEGGSGRYVGGYRGSPLSDECEELIMVHPEVANTLKADKYLWKYVYYDPIVECRKRLRLTVPLHNLSRTSSITGSIRGSDYIGSNDESLVLSSRATSVSDAPLEEWRRQWWTVTLCTLFSEASGYFQILLNSVTAQLGKASLQYALDYLRAQQHRPDSQHQIARRLLIYAGDVYRYQFMYLPLLTFGDIAKVDTDGILLLARWMYGRAKAMYFDCGRACEQMALLSVYSHNTFEAIFWQTCGLCYEDQVGIRNKSILNLATSNKSALEDEDPIESMVVALVHAVLCGSSSVVLARYQALGEALDRDLAEISSGASTPLDLDKDFWKHEYMLSVVLAALLTSVASIGAVNGRQEDYLLVIQHLAITVLLRQMLCLKQALLLAGGGPEGGIIYPLVSIALWMDIWRAGPYLTDAYAYAHSRPASSDFAKKTEDMFACLIELVRANTDIRLSRSAELQRELSCMILPHDISLMGWVSLRPVQRELQYDTIKNLPTLSPSAMNPLASTVESSAGSETGEAGEAGGKGRGLWDDADYSMRIVFSRAQMLMLSLAKRSLLQFLSWDPDDELVVETESTRRERQERQMRVMAASMLEHQANNKQRPAKNAQPKHLSRPLRIPDFECWCYHLPTLERWIRSNAYCIVFSASVLRGIDGAKSDKQIGFRARSVSQFIDEEREREDTPLVLQRPGAQLNAWESAQQYLLSDEEFEAEGMDGDGGGNGDGDMPSVLDVPEEMQPILSCALYYIHVKAAEHGVEIVTESEELEFYASWFGIPCVSPVSPPTKKASINSHAS
ncbi:hypothetical protein GQ54DRAFT_304248 [Martensiomyces pterosporus]|nr:hypothetical protein GQ54DRAFT_304248 [Martensiomyces pterosporus]